MAKKRLHGENCSGNWRAGAGRREFLKGAAAIAAGIVVTPAGKAENALSLPTVPLGLHRVTRLIVGSNPIYGYSHFNRLYSKHMTEWFTDDRIVKFLLECERAGINTWQASYNTRMPEQFPKIRGAGCNIQWICLAAGWHLDEKFPDTVQGIASGMIKCAEAAARLKPIGIAHHGSATDRLFRAGELDSIKGFVDRVHDLGLLAGISTHNPVILEALEAKGWSHDFYMTSFHYQTRRAEEFKKEFGIAPIGEVYLDSDPPRMCSVIRKVGKPCLVYKILAAGRKCESPEQVRRAIEWAYKNIKPIDAAIVGMYPRFSDQIGDNTRTVREILS
ncbi:MAG TPA: hypothetical protein VGQ81_09055 [Acidobacteriota bacterium]|jgi:hypothetical protein|nr:hypothetical protein [Acidobacteriota bacterium]